MSDSGQSSVATHRAALHDSDGRVTLECEECGDAFEIWRSQADGRRFCSNACQGQHGRVTGDTAWITRDIDKEQVAEAAERAGSIADLADRLECSSLKALRLLGAHDIGIGDSTIDPPTGVSDSA